METITFEVLKQAVEIAKQENVRTVAALRKRLLQQGYTAGQTNLAIEFWVNHEAKKHMPRSTPTIKVGAACKYLDDAGETQHQLNFGAVTIKRLCTLDRKYKFALLWALVDHNTRALRNQINAVAALPECLRMWRLGSDLLPAATHESTAEFYGTREIRERIDARLAKCGELARAANIRLSFHPGQFVVLASQNPGIRANAMRELEYHCDCFTRMGYTGWHPNGLAVNVHVGVKNAAVKEMRAALASANQNVKDMVTLENDEFSWGARAIVDHFGDLVPVVLDVHHYWIERGKRLSSTSKIVDDIRATWKGIQPKLHLAMSHPELCAVKPTANLVLEKLMAAGNTKGALRAHSIEPWHTRSIDYAAKFGFDIMWEGKNKSIGAVQIAKHLGFT